MARTLYSRRTYLSARGVNTIKDRNGKIAYILSGRWGMMPAVMEVYDVSDQRLAQIRQRSLGILPRFELYDTNQEMVGSLRRYYRMGPEILFVSGLNWVVLGNSLHFNYRVYHGRKLIMTLKEFSAQNQADLAMTVTEQKDEPICLCLAAILDFWAKTPHKKKQLRFNHKYHQLGNFS